MDRRIRKLRRADDGKYHLSVNVPFTATFTATTTNALTGLPKDYDTSNNNFPSIDGTTFTNFSDYYSKWKQTTSGSVPLVRGTAAIILAPGQEPNWTTSTDGLESVSDAYQSAMPIGGLIVPSGVGQYSCSAVTLTIDPIATAVVMDDVITDMKDAYEKIAAARSTSEQQAVPARKQEQRPKRQPQKYVGVGTIDDRNASVVGTAATTYGTVIKKVVNDDGSEGGNGTVKIPYAISTYPPSYNGVIEYVVSFVENPNMIWAMNETDLSSGANTWIMRNIDVGRNFMVQNPAMVQLKPNITEGEKTEVEDSFKMVNVRDLSATWGAFVIMVQSPYINAAMEQWKFTDKEGNDSYYLTPKGVLHGNIRYDFIFETI